MKATALFTVIYSALHSLEYTNQTRGWTSEQSQFHPRRDGGREVNQTTDSYLVRRLRMSGAVPSRPPRLLVIHFSHWQKSGLNLNKKRADTFFENVRSPNTWKCQYRLKFCCQTNYVIKQCERCLSVQQLFLKICFVKNNKD